FRVARECTSTRLRRAGRAVTAIFDQTMAEVGLRGTQFSLLTALRLAGEAPVSRLAELLELDRTTMTRNLEPLERDGLIETDPALADRRVRLVRLTEKGRKTLERGLPLWEAAQEKVIAMLGEAPWLNLMRSLDTLTALRPE